MKNVFDILDELDNRYENKDWSINEAIELAIEETSKVKDEKFIKLLDKLKLNIKEETIRFADYPIIHQIIHLDIEEIKQRIKEE